MAIHVEHTFLVAAPIHLVWDYFADPPQVVPCLPGAELLEIIDAQSYRGAVGLRVGPVSAQYHGRAEILDIDPDRRIMQLRVGGEQQGAPGRAEATILFTLTEAASTRTEIKIAADVTISGKLAQVGGGMIQSVSKFMFTQFAKCVVKTLTEMGATGNEPSGTE